MSRLIFLFAVAGLVYWLLKSYRKPLSHKKEVVEEDMVQCAHCGVYLPRSESIAVAKKYYCSEAHRRAESEPRSS